VVLWGDSREYRLYMLSPEGKLLKRIVKETRPRAITEAERDGYRDKHADALKFGMQLSFRDRFPEFSGVFFDDKGRLFVRTYERADGRPDSFIYDVFAPDGVYESKVAVPATLDRNSVWKDGRIYTVESDEGGLPLIMRHKVVWKRGAPAS
jgi:hypothetical protein